MLAGAVKRVFTSGPAGPAGATLAAALTDVTAGIRAVLTAPDLATARANFGLAIGASVQAWSATLDAIVATGVSNAMLVKAPPGTLKANLQASTGAVTDQTLSAILDALIGSTRGALLVRGASTWGPLALGANGTTLQSNGADAVFAAASPGTGAVRYDAAQTLSPAQQLQERQNTGVRGAGVLAKSAAYTVALTDAGRLIACAGTFALTLPAASAAGAGFAIEVACSTGRVTLTPNGSDTIRGAVALVVNPLESGTLVSDGTNWQAVGFGAVVVAASLGLSGYRQWSDGLIQNWGTFNPGDANDATIPFAKAYPTAVLGIWPSINANPGNTLLVATTDSQTLANFVLRRRKYDGSAIASLNASVFWEAIGY